MKKIIAAFCISSVAFAQIPAGYYNTAAGTGYTLKTQLHNIIDNNTNSSGTASYGDLWDLFTETQFRDTYYENDGSLLDLYSEKPTGADSYNFTNTSQQCGNYGSEGDCYNREHIMPQSVFNSNYPMYSDAHFVLPSDGKVNGQRGNLPFGKVGTANWTSTNGSKRGTNLNSGYSAGYTSDVFEPIDEFKGDVARALFYFATRYEDQITSWSYAMFNGTSTQVYTDTFKNILLTWHQLDPVSAYEIAKNNKVYTFQNNRNPFIDHPEYITTIWGSPLSTEDIYANFSVRLYPNPIKNQQFSLVSNYKIDAVLIYNINGQVVQKITNPFETITLNNLPAGFYFVNITAENLQTVKKIVVE